MDTMSNNAIQCENTSVLMLCDQCPEWDGFFALFVPFGGEQLIGTVHEVWGVNGGKCNR